MPKRAVERDPNIPQEEKDQILEERRRRKLETNSKYLATGTGTVKTFALRMPQQWYQPLREYVDAHGDTYLSVNDLICRLIYREVGEAAGLDEYQIPRH